MKFPNKNRKEQKECCIWCFIKEPQTKTTSKKRSEIPFKSCTWTKSSPLCLMPEIWITMGIVSWILLIKWTAWEATNSSSLNFFGISSSYGYGIFFFGKNWIFITLFFLNCFTSGLSGSSSCCCCCFGSTSLLFFSFLISSIFAFA